MNINQVTPFSVQDYLYALARTPTPKRFDKYRQRLLEGKPSLSRIRRLSQDFGCTATIGATSPQNDQASRDAVLDAEKRVNAKGSQRALDSKTDALNVERITQVAQPVLLNPTFDGAREEVNEVTEEGHMVEDLLLKSLSTTAVEASKESYQKNTDDGSMFVSAETMYVRLRRVRNNTCLSQARWLCRSFSRPMMC